MSSKAFISKAFLDRWNRLADHIEQRSHQLATSGKLAGPLEDGHPPQSLLELDAELEPVLSEVLSGTPSGTVGDMMLVQMQYSLLGAWSRANSLRHLRQVPALYLSAMRQLGHAMPAGYFRHGVPSYLQAIDKLSKKP